MNELERRRFTELSPQILSIASSFKIMFFKSSVPEKSEKSVLSKFVINYFNVL
jgi:hypothetical protein